MADRKTVGAYGESHFTQTEVGYFNCSVSLLPVWVFVGAFAGARAFRVSCLFRIHPAGLFVGWRNYSPVHCWHRNADYPGIAMVCARATSKLRFDSGQLFCQPENNELSWRCSLRTRANGSSLQIIAETLILSHTE